ncbi:hypothetical protein ES703_82394 [subsurface metagenome]
MKVLTTSLRQFIALVLLYLWWWLLKMTILSLSRVIVVLQRPNRSVLLRFRAVSAKLVALRALK